jgi:anthranilate phosphoribosyltransferase
METNTQAGLIKHVVEGGTLDTDEMAGLFSALAGPVDPELPEDQRHWFMLALISALMSRGPTTSELVGVVKSTQSQLPTLNVRTNLPIVDVSGTGGDVMSTINVSTAAALVLAATGEVVVAKQSTRAYTSTSGSSDVLQALGLDPFSESRASVIDSLETFGLCYYYGPGLRPEGFAGRTSFLRHFTLTPLRFRTPWHLVGWLASPVTLTHRLYGVSRTADLQLLAPVMQQCGFQSGMLVHALSGMDEVDISGESLVMRCDASGVEEFKVNPRDFDIEPVALHEIAPEFILGKPVTSLRVEDYARLFVNAIAPIGDQNLKSLVCINSALALCLATGTSMPEAYDRCLEVITNGRAIGKLIEYARTRGVEVPYV